MSNQEEPPNATTWDGMEAQETDSLLLQSKNDENDNDHHHTGLLATITEGVVLGVEAIVETTGEVMEGMTEMAGDVAENIQEVAHEVQEAVVEEVHHVQEALMDELHEADEGDVFFLEMSLTRNLSILPGDKNLTEAVVEAQEASHNIVTTGISCKCLSSVMESFSDDGSATSPRNDEEDGLVKQEETVVTGTPLSAYLVLMSAVVALSSIGPFLDLQKGVDPSMKIFWRMTGTAMFLSPMAIRELIYDGLPHLSYTQWCTFVLASASYSVMCVAFVTALDYTSVGNAVILSNSQSLLLLGGKFLVGAPLVFLEGAGALIAFTGAILCSRDHSSTAAQASPEDTSAGLSTLYGDGLALVSAIGGVFYLVFGKSLRSSMSVYVFMFLIMVLGSTLILVFMMCTQENLTFSRQIDYGIWGWMNIRPDRLPLEIAMVVVCNIIGAMGYVRAFQYFDNLVISVAALMEPVVAAFIAYEFNVGVLPGVMGWIGNVLVATGTLSVVYPIIDKTKGGGGH